MYKAVKNFAKQFAFEPKLENGSKLPAYKKFVVLGMGGSHLTADLLQTLDVYAGSIIVHSDYGLPALPEEELKSRLIIASSYSGNTEEVLDGLAAALKKNLAVACIAVGGKLLEVAKQKSIPYIQLPDTGIQPRSALGFSFRAMLRLINDEKLLAETLALAETLKPEELRDAGKNLALRIKGHVPIIYSSTRKHAVAYNWKIKFNETGKIPAFCNVIPEMNHNEMTGFDPAELTRALSEKFYFLMLEDSFDHPQNQKRMRVLGDLLQERGLPVERLRIEGKTHFHKIFSSLLLADWTAVYLAELYNVESEQVPMVEEFKKLINRA